MAKVKVGILGAGFAAGLHADILQDDERVEIVAIADLYIDKAKQLADTIKYDVQAVDSLDKLIELGVDAVYVTTPNTLHVEAVITCLENNIHVFSEKPMATTIEGARKILDATKKSEGIYNLGMNRRYAYVHKDIKEKIENKELAPYSAHIKLNRGELLNPAWTANPDVTGGFLYETTIHQLDLLSYFFGKIKTVKCEARKSLSDTQYDDFVMMFTFESGTIATLISSAHSGWSFPFESVEIYGEYSTVATEEIETIRYSKGLNKEVEKLDYTQVAFKEKCGYVEEDRLFIDAILNGEEPPVNAQEAFELTYLIEKIYESADTGETIHFNQEEVSQ
ncbi:Gfo/Idh/MocA family protein [Oceanobacillus alkalisoli]|uniref:Gfo/Idh/MocA family protein n=1 Tax=Oceanobacillus alkalisoli TaxID=2925113 RepID=UPI001EF1486A|nr:Gfo/Idh/MocA family oxidoreductase [Oceanobacillus alkalisoli]MCF3943305.1 Gfo/Idh/MocA family oxidoreductase [Oceanobacillus alkalisoli]MCG5103818.1 Gfo/Idh/MocA family oxidoreductase [Oceanobacillus alkalisoli]